MLAGGGPSAVRRPRFTIFAAISLLLFVTIAVATFGLEDHIFWAYQSPDRLRNAFVVAGEVVVKRRTDSGASSAYAVAERNHPFIVGLYTVSTMADGG